MIEKITEMLVDLDRKQATYQSIHLFYYGEEDKEAKNIHRLLVNICEQVYEGKNEIRRKT